LKKRELKNIIKECIREILFEENFLSPIISEVVRGVGADQRLVEVRKTVGEPETRANVEGNTNYNKLNETKRAMMDKIGRNSLNGVNVFDGISGDVVAEKSRTGISLDSIPGLNFSAQIIKKMS
jgi:hypothetical protein